MLNRRQARVGGHIRCAAQEVSLRRIVLSHCKEKLPIRLEPYMSIAVSENPPQSETSAGSSLFRLLAYTKPRATTNQLEQAVKASNNWII